MKLYFLVLDIRRSILGCNLLINYLRWHFNYFVKIGKALKPGPIAANKFSFCDWIIYMCFHKILMYNQELYSISKNNISGFFIVPEKKKGRGVVDTPSSPSKPILLLGPNLHHQPVIISCGFLIPSQNIKYSEPLNTDKKLFVIQMEAYL